MNYFKIVVAHNHGTDTFFPFDEDDAASLATAWWNVLRSEQPVAVYKPLKCDGPWNDLPCVGEGIDGQALRAYMEGHFADDDADVSN